MFAMLSRTLTAIDCIARTRTATARARLGCILDAGVRRFVDLTTPADRLERYDDMLSGLAAERGIRVTHLTHPITDLGVPTAVEMRSILKVLMSPHDGLTYFHCWGGIGRTGTVAGCLLVEAGYTPQEALALIAQKWTTMEKRLRRTESPETFEQFEFVRNWKAGSERSD